MANTPFSRALAVPSCLLLALISSCGGSGGSGVSGLAPGPGGNASAKPNILFVVMDDVGVDQMKSFGYGGSTPPGMPNMDAVAGAGVRFRNTWSMPECSPGRAAMFSGRFPLRTNNFAALGPYDLANSQISSSETTTPKLLKQANYESAMFGKFHLAGPDNNEDGNNTPIQLGWDYFQGWIRGGPASIDTTAGGVAAQGTYACGFVPGAAAGGADTGACYHADNSCSTITGASAKGDAPGKQCLTQGGIFKPGGTCQSPSPAGLDFTRANAYYVSPLVIADADGVQTPPNSDPRNRGYRTTLETQGAIDWIRSRSGNRPWMATVSYSAAHTPYQQAPGNLVQGPPGDDLNCNTFEPQRVLSNKMTEAVDSEFGRLLVETGLARRNADGTLAYDPKASNTVIVIVGDNGSFANAVKEPFDIGRAKSTAYQTGVWVPLIVAGNVVASPNRDVEHMTNMVDVFRLFGEIAGLDVVASVPRTIDAAPLMPYLTRADQPGIRSVNFTQGGYNVQANGQRNGACIVKTVIAGRTVASICTQSVFDKGPCEDNAGVWWGPGYTDASVIATGHPSDAGYRSCWEVNQAEHKAGVALTPISPEITIAVRNNSYKLVRNTVQTYDAATDTGGPVTADEFYAVDQATPTPKLDKSGMDLLPARATWSPAVLQAYDSLTAQLDTILASQPACVGDGNIDNEVNATDIGLWSRIHRAWGLSSMFDFNLDGKTDFADLALIHQNTGKCKPSSAIF
ncbi:sulfatase-like hydrolase/transferase [Variovorax sp. J22P168]|uniref:sulfatase-like hydrolase/transferase n=1 Tax=Variovorax jilinensis TaxID=3053513 RepID=UPI002574C8EE|nr:sulfatase-like hydrolase/transferase [Variovorax sp. J22P168]MDM0014697.1 sulfatase-like hydrolase/transferase [Variovorax sp. J22P168]